MTDEQFAIGDVVRITRKVTVVGGYVGTITRRAHPASPWTWVVNNFPGETFWGAAVNEDEIEAA